jgi:hypothetical protein
MAPPKVAYLAGLEDLLFQAYQLDTHGDTIVIASAAGQ